MVRFRYDNIEANKLILEFKCKKCHSLTKTELLSVPELDLKSFKDTRCSFKHECQCGACYTIDIINGLYEGYGLIHRIIGNEEDVFVHEVPDFPYGKETILVDTIQSYSRIESIADGIEGMSKSDKDYVYCLLFSNLVSILDSFIKIYTEPLILSNIVLTNRFCSKFGIDKKSTDEKKQAVVDYYKRRSFQYIPNQKKLFEKVFNVDIVFDDELEQIVAIRDVIIHRNAITPAGYIHKIHKNYLIKALKVIKNHIHNINKVLIDYEINILCERIINSNIQ